MTAPLTLAFLFGTFNDMTLGEWLKSVDKTTDDFAKEIKASGGTVRRYVRGIRTPRKAMKVRIRNATKGRVRFRDWPDWDPEEDKFDEALVAS